MSELWNEYEENSTPEAKIVKDFDKVLASLLWECFEILLMWKLFWILSNFVQETICWEGISSCKESIL